jgi:hypothetical protein
LPITSSAFDRTRPCAGAWAGTEHEVEDKKNAGMEAEAELLARAMPPGALFCTSTNAGRRLTSPEFAALLAKWRDGGRQDLAFVIGGADGLTRPSGTRADFIDQLRADGLAAYAGAGDAGRAIVPCRDDPCRRPLSPGVTHAIPPPSIPC